VYRYCKHYYNNHNDLRRRVCLEYIFYTLHLAVIACAWGDTTIDASANANVGSYAESAFSMDSGVAVVDGLGNLGPRTL
jgi:hypothetical protein